MSRLVIIESPYAGDIEANVFYARACMRHSIELGEAPIASHLLYTQPGILRDEVPDERERGIAAGLAWRRVAEVAVFYTDRGWSGGMRAAREVYEREGFPFEERAIGSVSGLDAPVDAYGKRTDAWRFTDGLIPEVDEDGDCQECAAAIETRAFPCDECGHIDEDDGYPGPCTSRQGHSWVVSDADDRSYCEFCGADGDA